MRFLTAGESHGKFLVAILEGMPAGLRLDIKEINEELRRRQQGVGRGARMRLERDKVFAITGLAKGKTIGAPIGIIIKNCDSSIDRLPLVLVPRPGHADLAGVLKYGFNDARCVLERASARETAARVAVGAVCKILLEQFKIKIKSRILSIGGLRGISEIKKLIAAAKRNKDTLGGIFQVQVKNCLCGLGSYVHYERRLDGILAGAIMSIPAIKAVEIGMGLACSEKFGSEVQDVIHFANGKFLRLTNNAGGLEGGVTNGQDLVIRAAMKPISTLGDPLDSVNIRTKKKAKASVQRYDTCAVEAASVIAENMVAFCLSQAFLEKFGNDNMEDIKVSLAHYRKRTRS
ncbi:MAG: chorismate synthase [Candidatus Omnitrophica bacterium]|nr:chorismate synthase [Candidatus Omnitrophota bacterium]